mmetsp:Transcript_2002/g.3196  ORF Transcript_2002/g.3196 Transcript_2002/m.3196 type:complete len:276 (-) Transcript_2002:112-939(-)
MLRNITKVQNTACQVCQSNNGLHFDCVSFLQGMIQDPWSVNDLPTQVLVIAMTYKERFRGEGVWLDINVTTSDLVHETRLSHVGQAAHEDGSCVRVQGWKTRKMLTNFLQIRQGCFLSLQDGAHTTQGCTLQTLATIGRVRVLDHSNHIPRDLIHQRPCRVKLTQSKLIVIPVVQRVAQISIERMDIIEAGEISQNGRQSLRNCLLCEFDLSHVEGPDPRNLVSRMNDCWSAALRPHQNNVNQFRCSRHRAHFLEVVDWHGDDFSVEKGWIEQLP